MDSNHRHKRLISRGNFTAPQKLSRPFRSALRLPLGNCSLEESTRSPSAFFKFYKVLNPVVGPSGLEPPTSCLSGTRSNLLSYEPLWLVCGFAHLSIVLFKDLVEMMGFGLARTARSVFLGRERPPEVRSVPIPLRILLCK